VVVRAQGGGERHGRRIILAAVPRLLAVLIVAAVALAGCGSSAKDEKSGESGASTPAATETATAANEFLPQGCENVSKPEAKDVGKLKKPTEKLSKSKTYVATVSTTCGDFEITLDAKRAPITGGSFKYLADKKFFDGLAFHRIVPDFVIQGGDPVGDGSGGPGYSVVEAPPSSLEYTAGVVAMAKTQNEAAGTSGSQFFVVTGDQASTLTPDYALLGKVTQGMDVVTKIGGIQSDPSTGQPAAPVVIKSITVAAK
jgi:peptidyl-prolyl cis-trans isomerase B (cyclophilin B)